MNKKIISMAVAAALVAPLAQAEVTVGGRMYIEYDMFSVNGGGPGLDGASVADDQGIGRIFFKASEDLGNGISMYGKHEIQYQQGTGGGSFGMRDGYVGIKGGFGDFAMGDFVGAYSQTGVDPFVGTALQARGNGGHNTAGNGISHNGFTRSMMQYKTKVGGAKINLQTNALNSDAGEFGAPTVMQLHVKMGGLAIATATNDNGSDPAPSDGGNTKVAYKGKAGGLKYAVQYEMISGADGSNQTTGDGNVLYFNVGMDMGKNNTVYLAVGALTSDADATEDAAYMMLGGKKSFSKTSSMYYGYRSTDVNNGVTGDSTSIAIGLRKDF